MKMRERERGARKEERDRKVRKGERDKKVRGRGERERGGKGEKG